MTAPMARPRGGYHCIVCNAPIFVNYTVVPKPVRYGDTWTHILRDDSHEPKPAELIPGEVGEP